MVIACCFLQQLPIFCLLFLLSQCFCFIYSFFTPVPRSITCRIFCDNIFLVVSGLLGIWPSNAIWVSTAFLLFVLEATCLVSFKVKSLWAFAYIYLVAIATSVISVFLGNGLVLSLSSILIIGMVESLRRYSRKIEDFARASHHQATKYERAIIASAKKEAEKMQIRALLQRLVNHEIANIMTKLLSNIQLDRLNYSSAKALLGEIKQALISIAFDTPACDLPIYKVILEVARNTANEAEFEGKIDFDPSMDTLKVTGRHSAWALAFKILIRSAIESKCSWIKIKADCYGQIILQDNGNGSAIYNSVYVKNSKPLHEAMGLEAIIEILDDIYYTIKMNGTPVGSKFIISRKANA